MAKRLITAPAVLPVDADTVKKSVRVLHSAEDVLVGIYISAATGKLDGPDGRMGRCIIAQTWGLSFDGFPAGDIVLTFGPVRSVAGIDYTDADGQPQSLLPSEFELIPDTTDRAFVRPVTSWPAGTAVKVRFVAGYAEDATDVPDAIRLAIMMWCGDFYRNREAQTPQALTENPACWALLSKYTRVAV